MQQHDAYYILFLPQKGCKRDKRVG